MQEKYLLKLACWLLKLVTLKEFVKDVQFKQGRSWGNGINYWKGCCFCKASGRKNRRQWTEMENSGRVSDRVDVFCGSLRWWNCHKRRVCDSFVGIILSCKHTKARPSLGLTNYYNTSFAFSLCMQVCIWYCVISHMHIISICVRMIEVYQCGCIVTCCIVISKNK